MPHTLSERIVAIAMLTASALLIILAVRETTGTDESQAAATVAEVRVTTPAPRTQPPGAAKSVPTKPKPLTRLRLLASGGDTWVSVRAGSAQGKALYAGMIAQGGEIAVEAKQLWVRFGGAANLTARLNGRPLPLRAGTYNALITPDGLQLVAG